MENREERLGLFDRTLQEIIGEWFDRVKSNYVTEEESRQLGVEPEIKIFNEPKMHRIKFARTRELDVTYGLSVYEKDGKFHIESSVNNKSAGFDYDSFVGKLRTHYWRSRNEKPWTHPDFDRFTYGDLTPFEPTMGESVVLDSREEKADIIRLHFPIRSRHEELLMAHPEILRDLIENYCLNPLKRIYAESYHEKS